MGLRIRMDFDRKTVKKKVSVICEYDKDLYRKVWRDRWDPYDNVPIDESGKLFYLLRKVVNSDDGRARRVLDIFSDHQKLIIFL